MRISHELESTSVIVLAGAERPVHRVLVKGLHTSTPWSSFNRQLLQHGLPLRLPADCGPVWVRRNKHTVGQWGRRGFTSSDGAGLVYTEKNQGNFLHFACGCPQPTATTLVRL